jgi:hypothetical protein
MFISIVVQTYSQSWRERETSESERPMPKEGFKSITVDTEVYKKIQIEMKKANEKAGYRKYRSVSHFVEEAIISYKS